MKIVFVFSLAFCAVWAKPVAYDPAAPEYGPYREGDMIEPFPGALDSYSGLINPNNRWPKGEIVYKYDSSLSQTAKSRTITAMANLESMTKKCITFREAEWFDQNKYVLIRSGSGCSATVGYWARTTHVNLSTRCSVGNIMHEFLHSLGIYHEQSRPDRDNYVRIALENVSSGYEHNFNKGSTDRVSTYNVPYDFGSIMHYSQYAFSKNGQKTIDPLPGKVPSGVTIGQRSKLNPGDLGKVKAMYQCQF